jgi:diguanylate cyclase (GGDEF)-like protein
LLGVGAPAGALAIRALGGIPDFSAELADHGFFYAYQLVGSCLVFGLGGWIVGRRADRYRSGRDLYRDLAEHDALTRLSNARAFMENQRRAVEHAARFHEPLSLLLLDVDELKSINDTLGHAAGQEALIAVARVLQACKREEDMAARWGGDEFAVLMRGADEAAAKQQANRILERLREQPPLLGGQKRAVSVTIGVATSHNGSADTLFQRADLALYAGKLAGRARVVSDTEIAPDRSSG